MKLQKLIVSVIFCLQSMQLFCMHPDEAIKLNPALKTQIEKIKQQNSLQNPDNETLQMVQNAIEYCNIKDRIILFQGQRRLEGKLRLDSKYNQYYLIVPQTSKSEKEAVVYHELGHYAHNDIKKNSRANIGIFLGIIGSTVLGIRQGYSLIKSLPLPLKLCASGIAGFASLCSSNVCAYLFGSYLERDKELRADLFMYKKLLEQNKIAPVMEEINTHLIGHQRDEEEEQQVKKAHIKRSFFAHPIFSSHPSGFKRAKIGIEQMKKHGISLKSIMANPPADLDANIKEHFPEQIKKWFPEELEK